MSYLNQTVQLGEIPSSGFFNQISQNIKDHIHGKDGVTLRFASLVVQPDSALGDEEALFGLNRADGSSLIKGLYGGREVASQFEADRLSVSSSTMVSNLNVERWQGRLISDLSLVGPQVIEISKFDWEDGCFYYNGEGGSTTATDWVLQFSFTFDLDHLRKQLLKFQVDLWGDPEPTAVAWIKVIAKKSNGQIISGTNTGRRSRDTADLYLVSLLSDLNSNPADFGETITIEVYLKAEDGTANWDEFYAYFPKACALGRL